MLCETEPDEELHNCCEGLQAEDSALQICIPRHFYRSKQLLSASLDHNIMLVLFCVLCVNKNTPWVLCEFTLIYQTKTSRSKLFYEVYLASQLKVMKYLWMTNKTQTADQTQWFLVCIVEHITADFLLHCPLFPSFRLVSVIVVLGMCWLV